MNLNAYEWSRAKALAKAPSVNEGSPPVPSLIMAAYMRADLAYRGAIEKGFKGIREEWERLVKEDQKPVKKGKR